MTQLPPIANEVVVADFDTELVVLVPRTRRAFHLEPAAALVFDSCQRGDTIERLVAEVAEATGQTHDDVTSWVSEMVEELGRHGLAENDAISGVQSDETPDHPRAGAR